MLWIKCILVFIAILPFQSDSQTVRIFTLNNFRGSSLTLNVSRCVESLPPTFLTPSGAPLLNSINTQDNCAQLYRNLGCQGDYLIVKPGTQHEQLSGYGWANVTRSIGPCHTKCHPHNIQEHNPLHTVEDVSFKVSPGVADPKRYTEFLNKVIPSVNLTVIGNNCLDTPQTIKDWPVKTARLRLKTSVCVEAHLLPSCRGPSYRLTLGSVPMTTFEFQLRLDQFGSFSLCGRDCKLGGISSGIDADSENVLHAAYLCGNLEYDPGHPCSNVTSVMHMGLPEGPGSNSQIEATRTIYAPVENKSSINSETSYAKSARAWNPDEKQGFVGSISDQLVKNRLNSPEAEDNQGGLGWGEIGLISLTVVAGIAALGWGAVLMLRKNRPYQNPKLRPSRGGLARGQLLDPEEGDN